MSRFTEQMTLQEARDILRELVYEGHKCPLCTQMAKVYKRRVNAGMAVSLIRMYRADPALDWQHVPTTVGGRSREEGKLRYWGLVEEEVTVKRDDGGRAGYWRVTPLGARFVRREVTLPRYALIYDGRCLKLEGEPTGIEVALGKRFSYYELMAGV